MGVIRAKTLGGQEVDVFSLPAGTLPQGIWVDLQDAAPEELQKIQSLFPLHPLALEDAREEGHWSRFETYPAHDFLTYRTLARAQECDEFTERISIFVFPGSAALRETAPGHSPPAPGLPGSVLTFSRHATIYLEKVWSLAGRDSVNTPAEVAYELIDHGADTFATYASALEERIEALQEKVFQDERLNVTGAVFGFKHNLARVRHLASEAREAVLLLVRHGHAEGGDQIRYRDALSNLDRAVSRLDAQREALTNLLDTALGFQAQRMNEVIRTLTVVSTIFLPLTFLAGVWGMNFKLMPELEWHYGYVLAWGSFVLTGLLMAAYFKRRGWW
ncbi:magnesium transporter CorA family protein [Deinococcus rubellus]